MHTQIPALLLCCVAAISVALAAPKDNTLIVPGKSIGDFHLDPETAKESAQELKTMKQMGDAVASDAALGGQGSEEYYLGAHPGDKGRAFHRPAEIGMNTLKDMEHDSAAHPGHVATVKIYVTSPDFQTAGGIAPGSTFDEIRAQFPDIKPDYAYYSGDDDAIVATRWPMFGQMDFFIDTKQGIAFAVRQSDHVCVEIDIVPPDTKGTYHFPPIAARDYQIDPNAHSLGDDIKPGMTGANLLLLLGAPDEKRDTATESGGTIWRWRVPAQGKEEPPGLDVFLSKLPDGSLIVRQIRFTSQAFMLADGEKVFPGCLLKDVLGQLHVQKLDIDAEEHVDVYGDLRQGLLFDIRQEDQVCTAITILPPPADVPWNIGPPKPKKTPLPKE